MSVKKKVVIVGAGFGGLSAARTLCKDKNFEIKIIDRRNHHLFQPLLYQVAMAGLSPAEIAYPIRRIFSGRKNVSVLMQTVKKISLQENTLETDYEKHSYDILILACGAAHSYFGHDDWEPFAPGLKTLEQATEIRRRVLTAFERAEQEKDLEKQKQFLTFAVIGGGPTGVELAGSLGEISRFCLNQEFRRIDPSRTRIILIEGGPRILNAYDEALSVKAQRFLEELGVQVWVNSRATKVDETGVKFGEEFVKASTIIWAAGVKPSELNQQLQSDLDSIGRVKVNEFCALKNFPNVYVIGDQAAFEITEKKILPGLAPVAIQQGIYVAKRIMKKLPSNKYFEYLDKGQMATIGRGRAIVEAFGLKIAGSLAWFMWLFIHILFLIGFKNRLFVIYEWAWSYFTFQRGARLIVGKEWKISQPS